MLERLQKEQLLFNYDFKADKKTISFLYREKGWK